MTDFVIDDGAYAHGKVTIAADYRCTQEDFIVEEQLGFELSGQGEHLCLWVEKRGQNTTFVAKQLAQYANLRVRDVSYCGLKDRHAITRQWFCLPIPIKAAFDWQGFECQGVSILKAVRHSKKLRTGVHQSNRFSIKLRNFSPVFDQAEDRESGECNRDPLKQIGERLELIKQYGVPNYFGPQRFGHQGNNLVRAEQLFAGEKIRDRQLKSIILSAARAYLFNQLLSARMTEYGFSQAIDGDLFRLMGSNSFFSSDVDQTISQRLTARDIAIALSLPGSSKVLSSADAHGFEQRIMAQFPTFVQGLNAFELSADSRDMVLVPEDFSYQWLNKATVLAIEFSLPKGSFATSVLRELVKLNDRSVKVMREIG